MDNSRLAGNGVDEIYLNGFHKNLLFLKTAGFFLLLEGNVKILDVKTNVFGAHTQVFVPFSYKNQRKQKKNREKSEAFVKLTKIGIEIFLAFVYNVFIAASKPKAA